MTDGVGCRPLSARPFPSAGERALNAAETKAVIAETNGFYKSLLEGKTDAGKLWVPKA